MIIGIDPGTSGGLAVVHYRPHYPPDVLHVIDLPIITVATGKVVDVETLRKLLFSFTPDMVVVEYPLWQRHDGATQASTSWRNFGRIEATVIMTCISSDRTALCLVSPTTWKKEMGLTLGRMADRKQRKALSMAVAKKLFGDKVLGYLSRVKDHDRAEALLLSYWGSLTPPPSTLK